MDSLFNTPSKVSPILQYNNSPASPQRELDRAPVSSVACSTSKAKPRPSHAHREKKAVEFEKSA